MYDDPISLAYNALDQRVLDFLDDLTAHDLALVCIAYNLRQYEGSSIGESLFYLRKSLERLEDK